MDKKVFVRKLFDLLFCKSICILFVPLENCACFITISALLLCLFYHYLALFTVPVLSLSAFSTVPVLSLFCKAIVPVLSLFIK